MPINLIETGNRIKHIRKKHNYSMAAFAKLVGNSSASTVNNWEKGNNLPKADRLEKIAILGNTSSDWIKYGNFKDYIQNLLNDSTTVSAPSSEELDQLTNHLLKKAISYEDDLRILQEAQKLLPHLFNRPYSEEIRQPQSLIAETEPDYLVERENGYRNHLLPLIDKLCDTPRSFELLTTAAYLLIEEDEETIAFLERKKTKK
ncbi:helix-turn-helix transcriptional regulator [uncultured Enterococcus sp.]|uniref:helix-turn-helix domain-containing protein n=1 Tax=uncultured Enterococcus sp. TaxID=167972 RepID=UPI002AA8D5DD|nr:helix-turn-helix transcriptional regulator [uncultured Enterococcus sp.]